MSEPGQNGFLYFHFMNNFLFFENLLYYSECVASWPDDIDYVQAPDHLGQSLRRYATFIKHHINDATSYILTLLAYTAVC